MELPKKLNTDAIAEALCEVRFESSEAAISPELVVGKLSSYQGWKGHNITRLPVADIPAPIRFQDPGLKYQPVLELRMAGGSRVAKLGANVLSFHTLAPYPGWDTFRAEIFGVLDFLFSTVSDFVASRLGFRYVNAFSESRHGIASVGDLNYGVKIAGGDLEGPQNLNYTFDRGNLHTCLCRIATKDFISGHDVGEISALIDIDVYTPVTFSTEDVELAKQWVNQAHDIEKTEFFRLLTHETIERLREK